ncbi:MAG TPA: CBS domain-containing protein [Kofleriaceae bacterium]|jgi:CBS domain-containing protein
MHLVDSESTTLRLKTLRRLLGRDRQLRVFDAGTSIGEVRWELAGTSAIAAIVGIDGVLSGTASFEDLAGFDPEVVVGDVTDRAAPMAEAEAEVEDAWQLLQERHADRVVVVSPSGELLGILTSAELEAAL